MTAVPEADVLDAELSKVHRTAAGEIRSVERFQFVQSSLDKAPPIFCLPGRADCEIFAKPQIPALVVQAGLTGFQYSSPFEASLLRSYLGEDLNVFPGVRA